MTYLCRKQYRVMAILGNRCAPTLTGESAKRFWEAMEEADRLPRRELPEDFFSDIDYCLRRSKEQSEKDRSVTIAEGKHEAEGHRIDK